MTAAGMGCRVSTAFRAIVDRACLKPDEWMAVHGCGGVGLSAVMIGAAMGAKILAIDLNEDALRMARRCGAENVLDVTACENVGEAIRDMTSGGAHVSLDALGISETFHNSIGGLRKLGRHVQIGMPLNAHANVDLPLLDLVYVRQISIMGTRGIPARRLPQLLELVTSGKIDPAMMIRETISLSDAGAALKAMDRYQSTGVAVIDRF